MKYEEVYKGNWNAVIAVVYVLYFSVVLWAD